MHKVVFLFHLLLVGQRTTTKDKFMKIGVNDA